jgi:hypothetical protein
MALYQRLGNTNAILRNSDGAVIPDDQGNADRQAYQAWLAIPGNVPDPVPGLTDAQVAAQQLGANDAVMFRALEVLIDVLLAKGVIAPTDFPPAVRQMYQARKALRTQAGVP